MRREYRGLGTALVTPFRDGKVDYDAFRALVRRQVEAGVDFLVPLGSTAETPCLEDEEKVNILKITKEESNGLPIVAGVGSNSPAATIRNMRLLDPFGADAYLVVVPFYNKPEQEGIYQYFKTIAEATDRDVILAQIPNVRAVKEASGNVTQIIDIRRQAPEGFTVLSGNDDQTLPLMASGCDGVISVASNVAPSQMKALADAAAAGDMEKAVALNNELMPLYHACFVESNPIPVKAALSIMGFCTPEMRLPLTEAVQSTRDLLSGIVGSYSK